MICQEKRSQLKIEKKRTNLWWVFCCIWHQVRWVTVNVCENLQKGSTLPSRGNGCNVQIGLLQCECVKLCCFVKAHTSPSLVSTVRTRMLLFTWASGVLVSRLVSKQWIQEEREHSVQEMQFYYPLFKGVLLCHQVQLHTVNTAYLKGTRVTPQTTNKFTNSESQNRRCSKISEGKKHVRC